MTLNDQQLEAVEHDESTVVLAGPGSGKTHTLVEKVVRLLDGQVAAPFAIACLTFSTDAVNEFTVRLRERGHRPGRRLFLGTVHGFCLTRVIKPYAHLTDQPNLGTRQVMTPRDQLAMRQQVLNQVGLSDDARWFEVILTRIRKDMACEDELTAHDERHIEVARQYEMMLAEHGLIDFDAMTFEALRIIDLHPEIADLLISRFPWIAVDEYQDLGGVLHLIVMALHRAGSHIFAVGDPDQCIYEWNGAKPATLSALVEAEDFKAVPLRYNYRSGQRLIDAAETALNQSRNYEPDPSRVDLGDVELIRCPPGLAAQAALIANETIPSLVSEGIPLHEIAILYPQKGVLLDAVAEALEDSCIPYRLERDGAFPSLPVVRWLQRCATYALNPIDDGPESFSDLAGPFRLLVADAGASGDHTELRTRIALYQALDEPVGVDTPLGPWLEYVIGKLDMTALLESAGRPDESEALRSVLSSIDDATTTPTVAEFANGARVQNRVVVTTYHSSKGRQFDAVLLPGLQHTLVPRARWNLKSRVMETTNMAEERRLFYVALTRSRQTAILYYSQLFTNKYGYNVDDYSIFIDEIAKRLRLQA